METINSITATAAKVIWGENNNTNETNANTANTTDGTANTATETKPVGTTTDSTTMNNETHGEEPISGKQGDVSKGEPYDAGNIEPENQTSSTGIEPTTTSTAAADSTASATSATEGTKGPTTEHPSTTGDTGFKAAQADVRDPDTNPTANPQKEEERKNVDHTGGLDQSENPNKVDGAGPKPIEDVAQERGGDAGNDGSAAKKDSAESTSAEDGAKNDKEDHGESKGTGEQYVKSSGLQADGGDFDATKPGAGREADRLLEEKGIANPAAAGAGTQKPEEDTTANQGHGEGEKKSLKEKIKAKLHKN